MNIYQRSATTAAVFVTTTALVLAGAGSALASPGHPGTPDAGRVVFHEDFEKAPDSGLRTMLSAYAGADGQRYSADSYWMNAVKANGMVLSWNNTKAANDATGAQNGTEVTAFNTLRQLSEAIGKINGTPTPQTNTVISAYTQDKGAAPAGNKVMFSSTENIALKDSEGRFLAFSLTAAATNGTNKAHPDRENPQLMFYVSRNGVETPLSTAPIDPIARGSQVSVTSLKDGANEAVYAGQFASDHSFLYEGGDFGIVIRNLTSAHMGNDGAFDDIKVLDVTPQLDKQFGQSEATTGDSVRLTFTVTNTAELANKKGWSFTDSLPAGLVVAADPDLVVDGTATVQAEPGADAIVVTDGDLASGDNALTISLNVTATKPGTYSNGPTNITVRKGLDSPDVTTVTFTDPAPVPTDLVVRYVDEQGNPLADEDTRSGNVGETYTTAAKDIPGYELVATPANATGELVKETTEVVYVYAKKPPAPAPADLTVRFVDEAGTPLIDPTHRDGTQGEHYDTNAAAIPGYELVATPANASGTMELGTEVVYVYKKIAVV
ncbi:MAG TPA: MucBP domain-containing protein, partial [Cellulomonas sp.]|nr:MucBP domain-containing protein [Cellulomonas sp.]